jgi:hypothetical protein
MWVPIRMSNRGLLRGSIRLRHVPQRLIVAQQPAD